MLHLRNDEEVEAYKEYLKTRTNDRLRILTSLYWVNIRHKIYTHDKIYLRLHLVNKEVERRLKGGNYSIRRTK